MTLRLRRCSVFISPVFMGLLTILMTLDTTGMLGYMLIAVLVHELGHLLFMGIYHCLPTQVYLMPFEINMVNSRPPEHAVHRLLISLGGICANLVTWLLIGGTFGQINLYLALFNAFPLYSMDGYQVLEHLFSFVPWGKGAVTALSVLVTCIAVGLGIGLLITNQNPMMLLFVVYMCVLGIKENR